MPAAHSMASAPSPDTQTAPWRAARGPNLAGRDNGRRQDVDIATPAQHRGAAVAAPQSSSACPSNLPIPANCIDGRAASQSPEQQPLPAPSRSLCTRRDCARQHTCRHSGYKEAHANAVLQCAPHGRGVYRSPLSTATAWPRRAAGGCGTEARGGALIQALSPDTRWLAACIALPPGARTPTLRAQPPSTRLRTANDTRQVPLQQQA
jgi:hypothetical protein